MTFWSLTNSDFPTNQTFHQFHDLDTELDLHRLWVVSMEHLQRVWHASRERLPLRTPGSVPFVGACMCSDCWDQFPRLYIDLMTYQVDFHRIERFPSSICDGCGMPAGSAYPSGHLVPSFILGLANAPIVETKFLELAMSLLDFSPRIPLGTFSILLVETNPFPNLSLFYWTMLFEYPSVLSRFCFSKPRINSKDIIHCTFTDGTRYVYVTHLGPFLFHVFEKSAGLNFQTLCKSPEKWKIFVISAHALACNRKQW